MIINIPFPAYIAALTHRHNITTQHLAKEIQRQHSTNTPENSLAMAEMLMQVRKSTINSVLGEGG